MPARQEKRSRRATEPGAILDLYARLVREALRDLARDPPAVLAYASYVRSDIYLDKYEEIFSAVAELATRRFKRSKPAKLLRRIDYTIEDYNEYNEHIIVLWIETRDRKRYEREVRLSLEELEILAEVSAGIDEVDRTLERLPSPWLLDEPPPISTRFDEILLDTIIEAYILTKLASDSPQARREAAGIIIDKFREEADKLTPVIRLEWSEGLVEIKPVKPEELASRLRVAPAELYQHSAEAVKRYTGSVAGFKVKIPAIITASHGKSGGRLEYTAVIDGEEAIYSDVSICNCCGPCYLLISNWTDFK